MSERERFEKWYEAYKMPAEGNWFQIYPDDGDYTYSTTQDAWEAWQASAREQMERDAEFIGNAIIPESFRKTGMYTEYEQGGDAYLKQIAASLRESFSREAGTPHE